MKGNKNIEKLHYILSDFYKNSEGSHDFEHILRVVKMAQYLCDKENLYEVTLIAYLHEILDDKLKTSEVTFDVFQLFFKEHQLKLDFDIKKVYQDIKSIGYKGGFKNVEKSPEAVLVSDADYLDAMGAIGIGRAFYYAGANKLPFHKKELEDFQALNYYQYRNKERNVIAHFDEKLLRLKKEIRSPKAQKIAKKRHKILLEFYHQFQSEINFKNEV